MFNGFFENQIMPGIVEMSWMKNMIKDMAIALSMPSPYNLKI